MIPGARTWAEREPIAILGIGCRFPGASDPEALWRVLREGEDAVREVPADRWDARALYEENLARPGTANTRWGAFLDRVDGFDARFFDISPGDARAMDPQHRLLLELAWEALERAGLSLGRISGSRTGVFVGQSNCDYVLSNAADLGRLSAYSAAGCTPSMVANRLSHFFDLRGPSMMLDTGCSSSLVATHLACRSLRSGECDTALVGAVSLHLSPMLTVSLSRAGMLSPSGRCKSFDRSADGYVRGEGAGMVVLRRLADARRDGDPVLALIRGTATSHGGHGPSLTVPNRGAQEDVIRRALEDAGLPAAQVDFVEAHGVGSPAGDALEAEALANVYGSASGRTHECLVGSLKTNIGHLEAAAGIAALIKTVLCLQKEQIPPNLHASDPSGPFALGESLLRIPTLQQPWPRGASPRLAAVNAFGLGGTNAHVVLQEASSGVVDGEIERPRHVLAFSAKSWSAVEALSRSYAAHLSADLVETPADVCFSANTGRTHFRCRGAVSGASLEELRAELETFASRVDRRAPLPPPHQRPRVAFLFGSIDDLPLDAVAELDATQPTFRAALRRWATNLGLPPDALAPERARKATRSQWRRMAWFAYQCALAELWRSWGAEPTAVFGRDLGALAAACVAGVVSPAEALALSSSTASLTLAARAEAGQGAPSGIALLSTDDELHAADLTIAVAMGTPWAHSTRRPVLPSFESGTSPWKTLLSSLGHLYEQGVEVRWSAFDEGYARRKVVLPTYPFERRRFWVDPAPSALSSAPPGLAQPDEAPPFRARRVEGGNPDEAVFETVVTAGDPLMAQHQVHGRIVAASTYFIPLVLAAAEERFGPGPKALEDLSFERVLVLDERSAHTLRLVLTTASAGLASFQLSSRPRSASIEGPWTVRATGQVRCLGGDGLPSTTMEAPPTPHERSAGAEDVYRAFHGWGIDLGPRFRWIEELSWTAGASALARLRLPMPDDQLGAFPIHPGQVDACFELLLACRPAQTAADPYVPLGIERLSLALPISGRLVGKAVVRASHEGGPEMFTGDVELLDESNRVVVRVERLLFKRAGREALEAAPTTARSTPPLGSSHLLSTLRSTAVGSRAVVLAAHLRELVVDLLGLDPGTPPDASRGFFDLGMSSLMVLELRNRLQLDLEGAVPLPAAAIFNHPSVDALTAHVLGLLGAPTPPSAPPARAEPAPRPREATEAALEAVERLSEPELDAAIATFATMHLPTQAGATEA